MSPRGVTLKLATSLDGRIATASGESRWITGPEARKAVHELRAQHQAVMIGIETALADDPELTVRLDGYDGPQPARVVLDSRQRLLADSKLAGTARDIPTYVVTCRAPRADLLDHGVKVLSVAEGEDGWLHPEAAVEALMAEGLARLMIEGGGQVAASFLSAGLIDRIEWFRAPIVLGSEGRPALGALNLSRLDEAPRFVRLEVRPLGADLWERYGKGGG